MNAVDRLLNRITMYRLVVYGLSLIIGIAVLLSLLGRISLSPFALTVSLATLVASCYITDQLFASIWHTPTNSESWLITALILFLILTPEISPVALSTLLLASIIACSSKFLLSWNNKHIFNPAALAAAVLSLTQLSPASWWVGSSVLWPCTLVVGLAIVRKIRRFSLVLAFVVVSTGLQLLLFITQGRPLMTSMRGALLASPLIFLATVMLTEPATMPPRRKQQIIFAVLIAILYITAWRLGPIYIYPEVAILLGNVYAFAVSPKLRIRMRLKETQKISDNVYNFIFQPYRKINFLPGQYMEWTLAAVPFDSRGNRRTLTIASSPTEDMVHLGIKFSEPSSAYKKVLRNLKPGDHIFAGQLAGNFTLPTDSSRKLVFVAGGIGITPFRSMLKYIIDSRQHRDIVLVYLVSNPADIAYKDILRQAQPCGARILIVSNGSSSINPALLSRLIPDFNERLFYISGPEGLVKAMTTHLGDLHVKRRFIKTDYFSGY